MSMVDLAIRLARLSVDVAHGGLNECPPELVRLFNLMLKEARAASPDPMLRTISVQKDGVSALTISVLSKQVALAATNE